MTSGLDPTLFAAAIVTVLASLFGGAIQLINAISAASDRRDAATERRVIREQGEQVKQVVASVDTKAGVIIESTAKIHELTNSTNSNLQKSLEVTTQKVVGLEHLMAQMQQDKRDLAAKQLSTDQQVRAAWQATPPTLVPPPLPPDDLGVRLKALNENTAALDRNTAAAPDLNALPSDVEPETPGDK